MSYSKKNGPKQQVAYPAQQEQLQALLLSGGARFS